MGNHIFFDKFDRFIRYFSLFQLTVSLKVNKPSHYPSLQLNRLLQIKKKKIVYNDELLN